VKVNYQIIRQLLKFAGFHEILWNSVLAGDYFYFDCPQ